LPKPSTELPRYIKEFDFEAKIAARKAQIKARMQGTKQNSPAESVIPATNKTFQTETMTDKNERKDAVESPAPVDEVVSDEPKEDVVELLTPVDEVVSQEPKVDVVVSQEPKGPHVSYWQLHLRSSPN
jgi:hypothetical protein